MFRPAPLFQYHTSSTASMTRRLAAHALILIPLLYLAGSSIPRPRPVAAGRAGLVRLPATASIWLAASTPDERNSSAGLFETVKLKSIQEMAAFRFDASAIRGREVRSARLFLHKAGADMLRYLRVSTVSQDWTAGRSRQPYGPADGATYLWADANQHRAWSFPGSEFADVVMGMGHSITTYAELTRESDDWLSVPLTPELVYALATEHTDGLAVMDGGNPAFFNNVIHSAQARDHAPYIDVDVGDPIVEVPSPPHVMVGPAPDRAHMSTGAIAVELRPDPGVFFWRVTIDGRPVPRWQVPYPPGVAMTGREQDHIASGRTARPGPVVFHLDDLEPERPHTLTVVAVGRGGAESPRVQFQTAASPALSNSVQLGPLTPPTGAAALVDGGRSFVVWPVPGLVKISPETGVAMFGDMSADGRRPGSLNAVWDGQAIQLFGGRGEYVSYQLVISRVDRAHTLTDVRVVPGTLTGSAGVIGRGDIELHKNWYARNRAGSWQPAYTIPWERSRPIEIPDQARGIGGQTNQSMYVDVYIPKHAAAGSYAGTVVVESGPDRAALPVKLQVYDFALPDTLSFWPELNSYRVPANALDFHRLAHQHRLVFNPWVVRPALRGGGKDIEVLWDGYDSSAGPLLSGDAFRRNRRAGVPTPVMYLPFIDSWPTPLSPETYRYSGAWPGRGGDRAALTDHYMAAPYIGDGLSASYQDAFLEVERQFVEHFARQRWNRTEMQLFFGGKNTHRINFGTNIWWTTDEPYHWDDWLALQFFGHLWTQGRKALGANPATWSVRADVSRPMWTGRVLDTVVDTIYWGGFSDARSYRRAAWLSEHTGVKTRAYGTANAATASNTESVSTLVQVWLHGADAFLPWQTLGDEASLDQNDNVDGNTLLVPGTRFALRVVGDMRLKALRDGQQLIEYLVLLGDRYGLQREQIRAMLEKVIPLSAETTGVAVDEAGRQRFGVLESWQLAALRRALAELIASR